MSKLIPLFFLCTLAWTVQAEQSLPCGRASLQELFDESTEFLIERATACPVKEFSKLQIRSFAHGYTETLQGEKIWQVNVQLHPYTEDSADLNGVFQCDDNRIVLISIGVTTKRCSAWSSVRNYKP